MSLEKIDRIKEDKGFKVWDLLVYGFIILSIAALFILFFFIGQGDPLTAINVYYNNNVILSYDFEQDKYELSGRQYLQIIGESDEELILKFSMHEDGSGYNIIEINKTERWVSVTEADCSSRRDCVYMDKVTDTADVIMCTPHRLKIQSSDYQFTDPSDIIIG